jgi:hypothetical protein
MELATSLCKATETRSPLVEENRVPSEYFADREYWPLRERGALANRNRREPLEKLIRRRSDPTVDAECQRHEAITAAVQRRVRVKVMAVQARGRYTGLGKGEVSQLHCYLIMSDAPQYGWEAPRNVL